jgi:hypothetical protein
MSKKRNEDQRITDSSENKLEANRKEQKLSPKLGQEIKGTAQKPKAQSIRHLKAGKDFNHF